MDFPVELHAPIFRDWGMHFMNQDEMDKAIKSFEKSIESNPEIFKSLLEHSICKLKIGRPEEALESAKKCMELFPNSPEAKHVYANSLYELNRMEDAMSRAVNTFYEHPNGQLGDKFVGTVKYNLEQAVCPEAGPLLRRLNNKLNNEKKAKSGDGPAAAEKEGTRWNESVQQDCDVISLNEEWQEELPPLEKMHRETMKTLCHDIYFDGTVREQIRFWELLKKHKAINLPQTPHSSKILTDIIGRILKRLNQYERMLYTRAPLFVKRAAEKGRSKESRMIAFYYMQQNTRREAFAQLDKVTSLAEQNFDEMLAFVEKIMLNFYAVRGEAIFPRKYEFMCEIYNFVGLQYVKILQTIPVKLMDADTEDRILLLLKTPTVKKPSAAVEKGDHLDSFGDRNAFNDPEAVDQTHINFSNRAKYFQKRISYSKRAIEKAYLYHQLSEHYLNNGRLEKSQQFARDVVAQASQCKSNLWKFLGYLNIVRADAMKRNFVRVTRNLKEMAKLAQLLSKYLVVFVRTAIRTKEDIETMQAAARKSSRLSRMSSRQSTTASNVSNTPSNVSNTPSRVSNSSL